MVDNTLLFMFMSSSPMHSTDQNVSGRGTNKFNVETKSEDSNKNKGCSEAVHFGPFHISMKFMYEFK